METMIDKRDFFSRFKPTGNKRSAIFGDRKALMEEIYEIGPLYCDQSYYATSSHLDLVVKNGNHFKCDVYEKFEDWRDCHYYSEYKDIDGNVVWVIEGGRYD